MKRNYPSRHETLRVNCGNNNKVNVCSLLYTFQQSKVKFMCISIVFFRYCYKLGRQCISCITLCQCCLLQLGKDNRVARVYHAFICACTKWNAHFSSRNICGDQTYCTIYGPEWWHSSSKYTLHTFKTRHLLSSQCVVKNSKQLH